MASIIREADVGDSAIIATVVRTAFRASAERFELTHENCPTHPSFCTKEWVEADMKRTVRYYILEIERRIGGCAALEQVHDEISFLQKLAVLPNHRRKGYGRALVHHILREAQTQGARVVRVAVITEFATLVKWYKKIGFIEVKSDRVANLPFGVTILERAFRDQNPAKSFANPSSSAAIKS